MSVIHAVKVDATRQSFQRIDMQFWFLKSRFLDQPDKASDELLGRAVRHLGDELHDTPP